MSGVMDSAVKKEKAEFIFKWVQKGRFTIAEGAEELHISEEEFIRQMSLSGFKSPKEESN